MCSRVPLPSLTNRKGCEGELGVRRAVLPRRVLRQAHNEARQESAKKAKNVEDPLLPKKYVQKGWPRGYEFGTHRMTRKLRSSELVYAESGNDSSSGFAW